VWHSHIEHRDVGPMLAVRDDRGVAIGGLSDDGEARVEFQDGGETHADDKVIVGE